MKGGLLWLVLLAPILHAQELPLPIWNADERKAFNEAGGVARHYLFAGEPETVVESKPDLPKAQEGEMTPDPVRSAEVPETFLSAYFEKKPAEYLVDPQGLLSAQDAKNRLAFLKYHASDSSVDFFVYVFGGDQEIPGEARAEEISERLLSTEKPAAVVFYFLGAPQRTTVYFSPSLTDAVPVVEQRRALQSAVMSAFEKMNVVDQLEAFCVQMSIRIYWMERMMGGGSGSEDVPMLLHEKVAAQEKEASIVDIWKVRVLDWVHAWWVVAAITTTALVFLFATVVWLKSRMKMRLPDLEVEPRLGGAHAAGVGAVISFASSGVPPASQKNQFPEYLRRA